MPSLSNCHRESPNGDCGSALKTVSALTLLPVATQLPNLPLIEIQGEIYMYDWPNSAPEVAVDMETRAR